MTKKKFDREKAQETVDKAIKAFVKFSSAESEINQHFVYKGFEREVDPFPVVSKETEVFLSFEGWEIDIDDAFEIMERRGYIKPSDFYGD